MGKLYPPNITYRYTISRENNGESSKNNPQEKLKKEGKKIGRRRYRPVYRWIRRYRDCITACGGIVFHFFDTYIYFYILGTTEVHNLKKENNNRNNQVMLRL